MVTDPLDNYFNNLKELENNYAGPENYLEPFGQTLEDIRNIIVEKLDVPHKHSINLQDTNLKLNHKTYRIPYEEKNEIKDNIIDLKKRQFITR
ncbi:hypothetical protein COBT_003390, partial [Conglomerata obtusa]